MIKTLKKLLLAALPLLVICAGAQQASAFDLFGPTCNGDKVQGGNGSQSPVCSKNSASKNNDGNDNVVLDTINKVINILAVLAGVVAVIMIMIAGFTYVTAGGNAEDTKKARGRIIYAAVGLAVIALSWAIVRFITSKILS